ncbi:hypothetical protein [Schinkia azotoformans]|uniref:hypothetical protein n=1 Tax=Schinkia azotoformans TaxID=1454 RepID=UPI002DBDB08C|nr:hypothetical protein [Schinkia azotoformans]MEC1717384.1 hypothetical protein [Schinkia azotoformans]MEC1740186.1 hypothetical protein [Schinkia azotoformans]MEC1747515.1 hypothetical protein [Schinkia azotoformans]MEC1757262.1 hypothetical protein [Schinkia azotoformans]MEC1765560.1 hypothetical protein [Schinkia azotoformans]
MGRRIEKQAEHLIIQQRDREVTTKIREFFNQKQKDLDEKPVHKKWYQFWK